MIGFRSEGGPVRQGLNIYPRRSASVGFLLALGRARLMLRYSRATGWLDFYGWREEARDVGFDL